MYSLIGILFLIVCGGCKAEAFLVVANLTGRKYLLGFEGECGMILEEKHRAIYASLLKYKVYKPLP